MNVTEIAFKTSLVLIFKRVFLGASISFKATIEEVVVHNFSEIECKRNTITWQVTLDGSTVLPSLSSKAMDDRTAGDDAACCSLVWYISLKQDKSNVWIIRTCSCSWSINLYSWPYQIHHQVHNLDITPLQSGCYNRWFSPFSTSKYGILVLR